MGRLIFLKIIPIAPNIPELNSVPLNTYLKVNETYINKLNNFERTELHLQLANLNFQKALDHFTNNNFKASSQIIEDIRKVYERLLGQGGMNFDLANILNNYFNYITTQFFIDNGLEHELSSDIIELLKHWNEINQNFNLIYLDINYVRSQVSEFKKNIEEIEKPENQVHSKTFFIGKVFYFAIFFSQNILGSVSVGKNPSAIDLLSQSYTTGNDVGLLKGFYKKLKNLCLKLAMKAPGMGPPPINLTEHQEKLDKIHKNLEQAFKLNEEKQYTVAKDVFDFAYKELKLLRSRKII